MRWTGFRRCGWALALACAMSAPCAEETFIVLQSTTSTQNSGFFDYLLPLYRAVSGVEVRAVAVGTGQALDNARNGDGDVVLVHAKAAEERFVAEGFGIARYDLMYNDFVIIGPAADPAAIRGSSSASAALRTIADRHAVFISRGDASGTHQKELDLWAENGVAVAAASGTWYRETGSGMGATLNVAVGLNGYTLSDRATWISFKNKDDFAILLEGDPKLFNQYGVIAVNPDRHRHAKAAAAGAFVEWLLGSDGQRAIAEFRVNGEQVFYANAHPQSLPGASAAP